MPEQLLIRVSVWSKQEKRSEKRQASSRRALWRSGTRLQLRMLVRAIIFVVFKVARTSCHPLQSFNFKRTEQNIKPKPEQHFCSLRLGSALWEKEKKICVGEKEVWNGE